MCHQRYWTLTCGHPCFINNFCQDAVEDAENKLRYLCVNATARKETSGPEDPVCRHPQCPHENSS